VADRRLAIAGLGERRAERRVVEDRVVAESRITARLASNLPFDRSFSFEHDAIIVGDRQLLIWIIGHRFWDWLVTTLFW